MAADTLSMVSNVSLVMFTMLLMQLVAGAAWAVGWWAMQLPRRPAMLWCQSALLGTAAMALILLRPWMAPWLGIPVSNLLALASALLLVRGMRVFLELPPRDREGGWLMAAVLVAGAVSAPRMAGIGTTITALATSLALLWTYGRAAADGQRALRGEFGARAAWSLVMPLILMCAIVGLRAVGALRGNVQALNVDTLPHVGMALLYLVLLTLLHLGMAAMVVLRLVARLRRLSTRDTLTGLVNRGEWMNQLGVQHRWLGRYGDAFSVLLIDIDHFKRVNDTWGHPAGDAVLVACAQQLAAAVRSCDLVGRLGGEEFVVLLPRTDAAASALIAERLRAALAAGTVGWRQQSIAVTVSVGAATCTDAAETPEQLIERVDEALYAAKHQGRNRVVMAPAPRALRAAA